MTTTVRQMLAGKAGAYSVNPNDTIFDALRLMADKNIGAVLVMSARPSRASCPSAIMRGRSSCSARPRRQRLSAKS